MSVTYRRAEPWDKFGTETTTFRVSMRYLLRGSRLGQAATDVGYTYSFRKGRLLLVSDRDLDRAIGSNRQPWDFGPVAVVRRVNVVVIANQGQLQRAVRLADETVAGAREIRKIWPGQLQTVPYVVALREPQVLTELPPTIPGDEPAQVRAMPSPASDSIQPAGGWLVLRQPALTTAQWSHVLMHLLPVRLGDGAPRWLSEGMAQYAGNLRLPAAQRAKMRAAITQQELTRLTRLPSDDEFTGGAGGGTAGGGGAGTGGGGEGVAGGGGAGVAGEGADGGVAGGRGAGTAAVGAGGVRGGGDGPAGRAAEGVSWLAVERLVSEAGVKRVTEYYRQVARRGYNDAARERLMQEYTGFTPARLVEAVRGTAR
ncbi:hypothetical protein [Kribbella sp. CA-294648]|uniref:hypothetical protein n=1 Tax=Kribbella sp. CA-294648 TaxID=3239948 RepID=UPI003D93821C